MRQRRRLILSLALLSFAGGAAIGALSVADSWQAWSWRLRVEQRYDLEVQLSNSHGLSDLVARIAALGAVEGIEAWSSLPAALAKPGGVPTHSTYPDDAHGAFELLAIPAATRMLDLEVTEGRWLRDDDRDAIVLNQVVPAGARVPLGATLSLSLEGQVRDFTVVGKVEQVGVGATAYANAAGLATPGLRRASQGRLRLRYRKELSEDGRRAAAKQVDELLHTLEVPVVATVALGIYQNAMVAHFEVLVGVLLALAGLTALVGALGLSAAVSVSVVERTRELGVMRAVGASSGQITQLVMREAMLVGAASALVSLALGVAIAWGLGTAVGQLSFALPLPLTPDFSAALMWTVVVLALSAAASFWPAQRAAQLTVKDAVAHV